MPQMRRPRPSAVRATMIKARRNTRSSLMLSKMSPRKVAVAMPSLQWCGRNDGAGKIPRGRRKVQDRAELELFLHAFDRSSCSRFRRTRVERMAPIGRDREPRAGAAGGSLRQRSLPRSRPAPSVRPFSQKAARHPPRPRFACHQGGRRGIAWRNGSVVGGRAGERPRRLIQRKDSDWGPPVTWVGSDELGATK